MTRIIPFADIVSIEKRLTANIIPNAIQIVTKDRTHFVYNSFTSRDTTYNLVIAVWGHNDVERFSDDEMADDGNGTREEEDEQRDTEDASEVIEYRCESGISKQYRLVLKRSRVRAFILARRRHRKELHDRRIAAGLSTAARVEDYQSAHEIEIEAEGEAGPITRHVQTEDDAEEYAGVVLDVKLATSPLKAFNLIFKDDSFIKAFWINSQGVKSTCFRSD